MRVLLALPFLAVSVAAAQSLPRSRSGPPGDPNAPTGQRAPVPIPVNPYEGAWTGTVSLRSSATGASNVAMTFAVDADGKVYNGETTMGSLRSKHLNPSAIPPGPDGQMLPRKRPAEGGEGAVFLNHPSYGPQLCDSNGRCADMPPVSWQEKSRSGETLAYSAKLVAADSIAGTIARDGQPVGTFALKRSK